MVSWSSKKCSKVYLPGKYSKIVSTNQEQSVLAKQSVQKVHVATRFSSQQNLKKKNTLNMCFFPMFTYGHTKGCITNRWRVTLKTTVRRSVSLVTIQTGKSGERPWKRHMNWLGKQTNQLKFIPHPYGSFLIENILFSRFTFICHVFEQNVLG